MATILTFRDCVLLLFLGIVVGLGVMVVMTNPRRTVNLHYATTTLFITGWLFCLFFGFRAHTGEEAAFWIRQACAVGSCIVLGYNMLRLSIIRPEDTWWKVVHRMRWWLGPHVLVLIMCQSDLFLSGAVLPAAPFDAVAEPIYGPLFRVYAVYTMVCLVTVWGLFFLNMRRSDGMQRAELQYNLLGCLTFLLFGGLATIFIPLVYGESQTVKFAFINAILMEGIVAYGIATRRILSMASLFRRITSYALIGGYLALVYAAVWFAVFWGLGHYSFSGTRFVANMLAAVVTAFSMAPAHGIFQRFAQRLFISLQPVDSQHLLQTASDMLHSVTTVPLLLVGFAEIVRKAVGTERAVVLIHEDDAFLPVAGSDLDQDDAPLLRMDDPIVQALGGQRILVRDYLSRSRETPESRRLRLRLTELGFEVVVAIRLREHLVGIMGLGRRLSGRIYSRDEQEALELLSSQLAVALENARLYTEAQDSRLYNEILLDSLPCGVIASSQSGKITVYNREAEAIVGLKAKAMLDAPDSALPAGIAALIEQIRQTGTPTRDHETQFEVPGREDLVWIRHSCSVFRGHQGDQLGVLLIFNDVTRLKRLQAQVAHSDRLASIGRLSAGMAHEIKNPLVTIRTFAQLIPERYADAEFRQTFESLVVEEVDRIDRIVRQLLQFARPSPPSLSMVHLHRIIDHAVSLVRYQAQKQNVSLVTEVTAERDLICADEAQIQQALLNLLLNGVEAMTEPGRLVVRTDNAAPPAGGATTGREETPGWVRVTIEDTGIGIEESQLGHIFEPFFTTKSTGTGLGLSVVHGIVTEHDGQIDVSSQPGKGTVFAIHLPLSDPPDSP